MSLGRESIDNPKARVDTENGIARMSTEWKIS
jgi:hypothetical protein